MTLLLSELVLRHEGVVRRPSTQAEAEAAGPGTGAGGPATGTGTEFFGVSNLLELLSDLVLHLPSCATSIHRCRNAEDGTAGGGGGGFSPEGSSTLCVRCWPPFCSCIGNSTSSARRVCSASSQDGSAEGGAWFGLAGCFSPHLWNQHIHPPLSISIFPARGRKSLEEVPPNMPVSPCATIS